MQSSSKEATPSGETDPIAAGRPPWRQPAFALFCIARTISAAGTGVTTVILPILIYQATGSPALTAALAAIETIPYLVFGLFAGVLADRLDRRKIMVACDVSCAVLLATVPLAAGLGHLVVAQILLVALGVATAFVWFDAANFGALPSLVDRAQLPAASSFAWASGIAASLVGPAAGGALLSLTSAPNVLLIDAISYVCSASLIFTIRRPLQRARPGRAESPRGPRELARSIMADAMVGLRFVWQQRIIRTMTVAVFAAAVSSGGTISLLVVYANRALRMPRTDPRIGVLFSAGVLGALVATLLLPALMKRLPLGRLASTFLLANTIALAGIALTTELFIALALLVCYQLTYTVVTTAGITTRLMLTPDHLQSRVNATGRLVAWGGQPVGALVGGTAADLLPIRFAFLIMCLPVLIGACIAMLSSLRSTCFGELSQAE